MVRTARHSEATRRQRRSDAEQVIYEHMTSEAERLIAKAEANQPRTVWCHRLHGFTVEVVNLNLFGNVLVKMPDGNMIEMRQAQFEINYEK